MKKRKVLLTLPLMLLPTIVFASSSSYGDIFPVSVALFMEAFATIHMSLFVLLPISKILAKDDSKKLFWKMFAIRAGILIFSDIFITTYIAIIDFFCVFIGAFLVVPILAAIKKVNPLTNRVTTNNIQINKTVSLQCSKCGTNLKETDNFCTNCGVPFNANLTNNTVVNQTKVTVLPSNFDSMYVLTEEKMLEEFINREIVKANIDKQTELIPQDVLKRKKVFNMIFSLLVFIFTSLIFFHFPIYTYIIGIVIIFIFFKATRNYNIIKYLKKQIKARPSERISNIVMNAKSSFVTDDSKNKFILLICIAVVLPLIIFMNPRVLYEKTDSGYAVRYYTFGLNNFTTAIIPDTYKGEEVVSLRGNTFSNMFLLKEINLPDTITEIRGQAFKNNKRLTKIKLPSNLEYLGGGAFYGCTSLESIELPDTLNYLGGESFYNAKSLKSIKLSDNLTEIRGNTFENCESLESIIIPDSVTRIGGHAFYGCSKLSSVTFTENSELKEIGSSAFRLCSSLYDITLPNNVLINTRSFKESPTSIRYFNMMDKNIYEHNRYVYVKIGETQKTNLYNSTTSIKDISINLVDVTKNNDLYEFTIKYTDIDSEQTFILTKATPSKKVADNIIIKIENEYVFKYYSDRVSLQVYYN